MEERKKSCTPWLIWNPVIHGISTISTGAGFFHLSSRSVSLPFVRFLQLATLPGWSSSASGIRPSWARNLSFWIAFWIRSLLIQPQTAHRSRVIGSHPTTSHVKGCNYLYVLIYIYICRYIYIYNPITLDLYAAKQLQIAQAREGPGSMRHYSRSYQVEENGWEAGLIFWVGSRKSSKCDLVICRDFPNSAIVCIGNIMIL